MRVLGRIRLSRFTDESTSVERQREIIEGWAKSNGHEVVAWAEDVDVSGSVSPFEAPALGPYFEAPLKDSWDIVCSWKLDRIARSSIALHQVFGWVKEHNKQLVCVSDNIDLSTWAGRLVASVIAGVAEGELEAIRERATASQMKLRSSGRWEGGRPPYGWMGKELSGGGFKLVHNPETMPVLRRMISDAIAGVALGSIATALNSEGVPTPGNQVNGKPGGVWRYQSVKKLLTTKTLLGWATHNGMPVLDELGKPVIKAEPAIDRETYNKLQAAIAQRSWEKTKPDETSPLLGVLECWHCGEVMHLRRRKDKPGNGAYSCSRGCKQIGPNAENVHALAEDLFRDELGSQQVQERRVTPATDNTKALAEAEAAYDDLAAFITTAPTPEARKSLFQQLETLGNRITSLKAEGSTPETVEWVSTGETYQDRWDALDTEGRRQLMLRAGIRFRVQQLTRGNGYKKGILQSEFIVPEDLRERLASTGG